MLEKIKFYANYVLGAVIVILGGFLFSRNRKLQSAESNLANALTKNVTQENDHEREIAKTHADDLVKSYDDLKREYDENKLGGGT